MRGWACALLAALAVVAVSGPSSARAQPGGPAAPGPVIDDAPLPVLAPPPSEAVQAAARALFREGNGLLRDSFFAEAVRRYQGALARWAHAAIHYNLAMALIQLDRPVEVHHHLRQALAFGPAPLGEHADDARRFLTLVEQQLVQVELTVAQPGGRLEVDGVEVFVGPGTWRSVVRAGTHDIRARAEGRVAVQRREHMQGGTTVKLDLDLYEITDPSWPVRRPLPPWVPPSIVLGGVMVLGFGAFNHVGAHDASRDFRDQLAACLPVDRGCGTRPELVGVRTAAASRYSLAFAMYGAGTVAVGLGIVLWHQNRPRTHRWLGAARAPSLSPVVGRDLAGVVARGTF